MLIAINNINLMGFVSAKNLLFVLICFWQACGGCGIFSKCCD
jgi:hypothetical protein